jgi:MFS family permease
VPTPVPGAPSAAKNPPAWPAPVRALLLGTLIARSCGFAYPFAAYHLDAVGLSSAATGLVLGSFGIGWLFGQMISGWLTDRVGYRITVTAACVVGGVALPVMAVGSNLAWLTGVSILAGAAYDAPRPAISAALAEIVTDEETRTTITGWRLAAINVGAALTGAVGGVLADRTGYGLLCLLNGLSFAAFAAVALPWLPRRTGPRPPSAGSARRELLADRRLWLVCASSLAAMTCAVGLMSALPMLMNADGLPATSYGWTQVTDAVAVVALTPVVNPLVARWGRRRGGLLRTQAASALILGVGMGATGLVHTTLGYCLAITAAVPGEIALYICATALIDLIAVPHLRGSYHGVFGTSFALSVTFAPLLTGWAMDAGGNAAAGVAILACGCLGAALCLPLTAAMARGRVLAPAGDTADFAVAAPSLTSARSTS